MTTITSGYYWIKLRGHGDKLTIGWLDSDERLWIVMGCGIMVNESDVSEVVAQIERPE